MAGSLNVSAENDDLTENHEINVTPFIDVMLVLLIVFMVAAPLATVDVDVDLPALTAEPKERPDEPLYLTLKADLTLVLGEVAVPADALQAALDRQTEGDRQTRIFLRADKVVPYGELMGVMNLLRDAGYLSIALVGLEGVPATGGSIGGHAASVDANDGGAAARDAEGASGPAGQAEHPIGADGERGAGRNP
ncbi:TonB system transport protein ExbD [Oricola sp.]|uniref:TonB system transport protein ExbD n=1 Tax=Oricola sp. TaxID=1979950 RepID=UPI0025E12EBE|nr:TonB system transport protein ExbD [Oricola sp.]MCI5074043.1 TonB system transport protein ExbD [Oricola sp.]